MAPAFADEIAGTKDTSEEASFYALELTNASAFPIVLNAAIQLELLEIISRAGFGSHVSAREIASQLPTKNPQAPEMVDRILRLLASHSVLTTVNANHETEDGSVERLYGLAPVAKYFLRNEKDVSLAHCLHLSHSQDRVFMDSWYALKDAVLEGGIPFNKVHGMNAFEYAGKDPKFNQHFNKAMISLTNLIMNGILEKYNGFEKLKELVDVGGGLGLTLKMITSKYPNIKAINFDLPHVIQHAPPYPGVQHVHGDMFVQLPKGEAILLKCILHDWGDDDCIKLLKNCYAAVPDDGKVIVIELIVPETIEINAATKCVFQIDVLMMTQNPGGKERTRRQYESLAKKAGFRGIDFVCYACNNWVMEFYK